MLLTAPPAPTAIRTLKNDEYERLHEKYPRLPKPDGQGLRHLRRQAGLPVVDRRQPHRGGRLGVQLHGAVPPAPRLAQRQHRADLPAPGLGRHDAAERGAVDKVMAYLENAEAYVRARASA